jgi:hypothetical protein
LCSDQSTAIKLQSNEKVYFWFRAFEHLVSCVDAETVLRAASIRSGNEEHGKQSKVIQVFLSQDITTCCFGLPNVIDLGLWQKCQASYLKNSQRQLENVESNGVPKGNCIAECIANRTQIYRGKGMVDRNSLLRIFLNSVIGFREWEGIVSNAVNMCINESESSPLRSLFTAHYSFL